MSLNKLILVKSGPSCSISSLAGKFYIKICLLLQGYRSEYVFEFLLRLTDSKNEYQIDLNEIQFDPLLIALENH